MRIDRLDHLVLTVADIATTVDFYTLVLGMESSSASVSTKSNPERAIVLPHH